MLLLSWLVILMSSTLTLQKKCRPQYPNGTNVVLHWYSCSNPHDALVVSGITLYDNEGERNYPVNVRRGITVDITAVNNSTQTFNSLLMDARLYYWGTAMGFGRCKWREIPTLGLTLNNDGCELSKICPISPGPASFKQPLDFGPFAYIIDQLGSNTVYQIEMRAKNGDTTGREQLSCVMVQGFMR